MGGEGWGLFAVFFIHCRRVVCAVFGAVGLFNKENERRQQGEKYRKLTQNSQQGNRENDNSSLFTQCLPKRSLLQLCTRFFLGTAPIALSGHALMLFSSLSDAVPSESGAIEARPGGSINGHIGKYYDSLFAVEKKKCPFSPNSIPTFPPIYCRHIVQILRILCRKIIILLCVAVTSTYSEHWTNGDNMEQHLI